MQFSLTAITLALASVAVAMPSQAGLESQDSAAVRWKVPKGMTVKEAQAKCGDQAQLSCCNKATYAGDTTDVNSGLGGGLLSNLIGTGSGADGAGIFDQCSKLDVQSQYCPVSPPLSETNDLSQSPSSSLSPSRTSSTSAASRTWPAVPLLLPPPPTTSLALAFPALLWAPSSKRFASRSRFSGSWKCPVVYLMFDFFLSDLGDMFALVFTHRSNIIST